MFIYMHIITIVLTQQIIIIYLNLKKMHSEISAGKYIFFSFSKPFLSVGLKIKCYDLNHKRLTSFLATRAA